MRDMYFKSEDIESVSDSRPEIERSVREIAVAIKKKRGRGFESNIFHGFVLLY